MAGIDLLADEPIDLLADDSQHESRGIKALKGIGEDWLHFGRNLASGGLEGLRGIGNIPHQLHLPNAPYFEPTDFNKMVGLSGEPSLSDKLIQGAAQFAPALIAPEANLGKVGKAIESIPKAGKYLKSIVGNAIPQGLYSATQEEKTPLSTGLQAGASTAPFSAAMTAIGARNPYARALGKLGLGALGAGAGYLGANALDLPKSAQYGAAALGAGTGLIGRNPRDKFLEKVAEQAKGSNYIEKLDAAKRLGLSHLTPGEATGSPYLMGIEGGLSRSEGGSKNLYDAGIKRNAQEKEAINKLFETIHPEQLDSKVKDLYTKAYEQKVPEEALKELKDNEVFKKAEKIVETKPAFKESLKGVSKNSIAYLDHIKKSLDDLINVSERKGANSEARILKQTREKLLSETDKVSPTYKEARNQSERQITKRNLEEKLNEHDVKGTSFFRAALNNDKRFDKLRNSLRNTPEAQSQLDDMRLVFRDLINPPTPRTAAGFAKAGMNQARNTKQGYQDMIKNLFNGKSSDTKMVELITNPKWAEDIKKINELKGYEKKLMTALNLMGKVSASSVTERKIKPMELEIIGKRRE